MSREIPLTRGYVAIVDDADYERVAALKWCALKACGKRQQVYATHYKRANGRVVAISMHRFLMGDPAGMIVDHIDSNGLNNTRANLRICTHAENMQNRKPHTRKASDCKFKGLILHKSGRIEARIRAEGRSLSLGYFKSHEDAARAYDAAAVKYHGEFARLNFPVAA